MQKDGPPPRNRRDHLHMAACATNRILGGAAECCAKKHALTHVGGLVPSSGRSPFRSAPRSTRPPSTTCSRATAPGARSLGAVVPFGWRRFRTRLQSLPHGFRPEASAHPHWEESGGGLVPLCRADYVAQRRRAEGHPRRGWHGGVRARRRPALRLRRRHGRSARPARQGATAHRAASRIRADRALRSRGDREHALTEPDEAGMVTRHRRGDAVGGARGAGGRGRPEGTNAWTHDARCRRVCVSTGLPDGDKCEGSTAGVCQSNRCSCGDRDQPCCGTTCRAGGGVPESATTAGGDATNVDQSKGCGCRTVGSSGGVGGARTLAGFALLGLAVRRRRVAPRRGAPSRGSAPVG